MAAQVCALLHNFSPLKSSALFWTEENFLPLDVTLSGNAFWFLDFGEFHHDAAMVYSAY